MILYAFLLPVRTCKRNTNQGWALIGPSGRVAIVLVLDRTTGWSAKGVHCSGRTDLWEGNYRRHVHTTSVCRRFRSSSRCSPPSRCDATSRTSQYFQTVRYEISYRLSRLQVLTSRSRATSAGGSQRWLQSGALTSCWLLWRAPLPATASPG